MTNTPELQPILFQQLEPSDPGYAEGHRFQVVQVDGDFHRFLTRERAEFFIAKHGLRPVCDEEMDELRRELYFPE